MTRILVSAIAAASLAGLAGEAGAGESACFDDWSVASEIVARERLPAIGELQARGVAGGAIVRASLCRDGDRYLYRLIVKDHNGQLRRTEVEARAR
ncbi:MAG: hypothetical protein JNM89_03335 [Hyphomicrobiaceae bacterium]|nr:hypothetical protein [Hyphomicrobiaceae bacterium]